MLEQLKKLIGADVKFLCDDGEKYSGKIVGVQKDPKLNGTYQFMIVIKPHCRMILMGHNKVFLPKGYMKLFGKDDEIKDVSRAELIDLEE